MELSRSDWCNRFAAAVLEFDESDNVAEAEWLSQAAYPSARLLTPELAAERFRGYLKAVDSWRAHASAPPPAR